MARGGAQGWSEVRDDVIQMKGGLDLKTPTLSLPAGFVRAAQNFEISITGGYARIAGYERYTGQAAPSSMTYTTVAVSSLVGYVQGQTIQGVTSGASGTLCGVTQLSTSPNTYALTLWNNTPFQVGETIKINGTTVAATVTTLVPAVTDAATSAQFTANAADVQRALMSPVPGQGRIRGVVYLNGVVYAWRDAVGGATTNIYKSTNAGWVQVPYQYLAGFTSNGTATNPGNGTAIKGVTSGATATVSVFAVQNYNTNLAGSWTSNAVSGVMLLTGITGTFQLNEVIEVTAGSVHFGTITSLPALIQPTAGGSYQFALGNFGGGGLAIQKAYGIDGVNKGFEFDGTNYLPITTGMSPDVPTNVCVHKFYLFLGFGPSLQFSALNYPYVWSPLLGSGEIALPEAITNLLVLPGNQSTGAMGVWTANDTFILYGSTFGSGANGQLASFNSGTGAIANTAQNMYDTYVFEMRGVVGLSTTLDYGNFEPSAVTMNIEPLIAAKRNIVSCSVLNRERGQYRVFFSDGTALYLTWLVKNYAGAMPVNFPDVVRCVCEGPAAAGASNIEATYFGTDSGHIMQLDSGTSFDGAAINAYMTFVYASEQSHRIIKRYRKASLEISGTSYASFTLGYSQAYGLTVYPTPAFASYTAPFALPLWGSFVWNNFTWDGLTLAPTECEVLGRGENIAITISSNVNYAAQWTLNTMTLAWSPGRRIR